MIILDSCLGKKDGFADMAHYNTERTNQVRYCQGRTPVQTFLEGLDLNQQHVCEELENEEAA